MARGAMLSAGKFVRCGRGFSASIIAAGKPLSQEKYQLTWKQPAGVNPISVFA
jgi:hypothetical protein